MMMVGNVEQIWESVKQAVVDSVGELCSSEGGKN